DWHLGRKLYGRNRYEEFQQCLDWFAEQIETQSIDVLLMAGDIFDTTAPTHRAQAMYYAFLCRVATSSCQHIVIIGGNHDSPSFLHAPSEILQQLHVHVIASVEHRAIEDEVMVLKDSNDVARLIVCAVPFLRDRDMRLVEAGESIADKEKKLAQAIAQHYADVAKIALQHQHNHQKVTGNRLPIVGMGHLFAVDGKVIEGDGVRELYVGNLAHVSASAFPDSFDYVALGHLHVPQKVGGCEHIRYSGSPLPMGFGEAEQSKIYHLLSCDDDSIHIENITIPVFQRLKMVCGDWQYIEASIQQLCQEEVSIWLEVQYTSDERMPDLRERLDALVEHSQVEILRVKNSSMHIPVMAAATHQERLDELEPLDVFNRCLMQHGLPERQQEDLRQSFQFLMNQMKQRDHGAE
ncbi:MAG: exonuclease SbcCD subunit D C-terminal domain-containing protein, partial [Mariprofundaceae bacterium]|nr:exonuclease SbcCD subunit D C-terminal domain-containing protein [Mariprofundaceae bacterium]